MSKIEIINLLLTRIEENRMSHFISGLNMPSQPILNQYPLKNIIAPKYKNVLKENTTKHSNKNETWKQQIAISNLCKKLTEKEFLLLRKQNATHIQHHFTKLKSRMKKSLQPNAPSVSRFFQNLKQDNTLNLQSILQKMPGKLQLATKHNKKLINFTQTLSTTHKISRDKQNYLKWLDQQNNSPVKSPNYSRMSFVLQRLEARGENWGGLGHQRRNGSQDGIGIEYVNRDRRGYRGKPCRIKTLGNDISGMYR